MNQSPEAFASADPYSVQALMLQQKAAEAELLAIRERGHKLASATPIDCSVPPAVGDYFTVIHGHRKRAGDIQTGLTSTHFPLEFERDGAFARGMISEGLNFVGAKHWNGLWPDNAKHLHDNETWGVLLVLPPGTKLEESMFVNAVWVETLAGADALAYSITKKDPQPLKSDPASVSKYLRVLAGMLPEGDQRSIRYSAAARKVDELVAEALLDAMPTTYPLPKKPIGT